MPCDPCEFYDKLCHNLVVYRPFLHTIDSEKPKFVIPKRVEIFERTQLENRSENVTQLEPYTNRDRGVCVYHSCDELYKLCEEQLILPLDPTQKVMIIQYENRSILFDSGSTHGFDLQEKLDGFDDPDNLAEFYEQFPLRADYFMGTFYFKPLKYPQWIIPGFPMGHIATIGMDRSLFYKLISGMP